MTKVFVTDPQDLRARTAIALRYAHPPEDFALADWVEYLDRVIGEARNRGVVITLTPAPENENE